MNDPEFLGKQGRSRNIDYEILSFIWTGFAVIHLPVLTAVLAATIPYWTMAKPGRIPQGAAALPSPKEAPDRMEPTERGLVSQGGSPHLSMAGRIVLSPTSGVNSLS